MTLEILGAIGTYLIFDVIFGGPVMVMASAAAKRISSGKGSSKKETLHEKEIELELRRCALAEKEAENRARKLAFREKRLTLIGEALDRGADTAILAALNDEERFELDDPSEKTPA